MTYLVEAFLSPGLTVAFDLCNQTMGELRDQMVMSARHTENHMIGTFDQTQHRR